MIDQGELFGSESYRRMNHGQLQRVIFDAYVRERWKVMHVRAMRTSDGRWLTGTSSAGFPDLLAVRAGWLSVVEVKIPPDKPKPEQIEWLTAFQAAGGLAWVIRPADPPQLLARWIARPEVAPERWGW